MSCLLPQFKCSPENFSVNFKPHNHSSIYPLKSRDPFNFRIQCVLSVTSSPTMTMTKVLELEKLQLQSLEAGPNSVSAETSWKMATSREMVATLDLEKLNLPSFDNRSIPVAANKPQSYIGGDTLSKVTLGATLATDSLLTSEDVAVAAAASEALALARAAVEVAKEASKMFRYNQTTKYDSDTRGDSSKVDKELLIESQLPQRSENTGVSDCKDSVTGRNPSLHPLEEYDYAESSVEELEFLETQLNNSVAVRSKRQKERKARRVRAAEKAAANFVPMNSASRSRKKRPIVQEMDYSDPLRYIRGTTSTSRLLTASEETMLSTGIQDLLKLERLEEELIGRYGGQPTFAQWAAAAGVDQKTLKERINYGIRCKHKMIKSNIRLVISIAKNYQGSGMNLQDLVQEGCRGLVRGAEKFDASKGFKFSTYAHWWIKQAVRKSLSDQSRTIRLPFHLVEATYRVKEAKKQLYSEHGRQPDDKEVAEATGLSMKRLSAVLLTPKAPKSLDQKIGINQNLKPSETIADPGAETSEELLIKQLMKQDLAKVLDSLNPRENQVVKWRFGLDDGRMKTLQEIGEIMGVSRERIRQIESCAFRKLKNKRRTKSLQQYAVPLATPPIN